MVKRVASIFVKVVKRLIEKIVFRIKLWQMDDYWRMIGGGCFGDYPPSFYCTHTPEEIKRIRQEELVRLRAMLEEFCEENGLEKPGQDSGGGSTTKVFL